MVMVLFRKALAVLVGLAQHVNSLRAPSSIKTLSLSDFR
jgi:hypothetical protein